jgi:hypothetical protein
MGYAHLDAANLTSLVTVYEEPSQLCLPRLVSEGLHIDFAFVDGHHLFDYVVAECLLLGKLLPRGGLLVIDDTNLPSIGRACDFFATNRADFEEITERLRHPAEADCRPGARRLP